MKSDEIERVSDIELTEHVYFYFVKTLSILAESPVEQCIAMDYFNVAWELHSEGLDVDRLICQEVIKFTDDQIEGMRELSLALHALNDEASGWSRGRAREEQLKVMSDRGWQLVRDIAKKLIVTLAPRTIENRKYFNMP